VKVWAATSQAGTQRVMVIHKDMFATAPANVHLQLSDGVTLRQAATLVRLTPGSAGVNATSGLTFGGLTFDGTADGIPTGTRVTEAVPADSDGHGYQLTVDPVSIVIVTLPSQ
jgi:hypothetical protein